MCVCIPSSVRDGNLVSRVMVCNWRRKGRRVVFRGWNKGEREHARLGAYETVEKERTKESASEHYGG